MNRTAGLPSWAAGLTVFGASAAVLVLEITALRLIAPYVGITLETNTAVIGLALAAIAVGAWAGGRAADARPPRPLLGPLLIGGGALVLAVTPLIRLLAGAVGSDDAAGIVLLFAAVAVFAPAALLSAIPPMVAKLALRTLDETGSVVGRLSGIGTLGAIVATFLTGFVLVAIVPTSVILLGTGTALVIGGLVLTVTARRTGKQKAPPVAGTLVLAAVAAGLGVVAPSPCALETDYHCAAVQADPDRDSGAVLILDTLRHSYLDRDDPSYLEFAYIRAIASGLDTVGEPGTPLDAVHVGGGGMTLPRYLLDQRPGGDNLVLEIDPGVVAVDRELLDLPDDPELRIEIGDGRIGLAALADDSADVVVGDAFGGVAVPWHLTTREAISDVDRVLRTDGLYAVNLIDFGPLDFARAEIATIADVFDHVVVIARPAALTDGSGGNIVVLAADRPLPRAEIEAAMAVRETPMTMQTDAELADFLGPAPLILTDDYAPVDQLLTPYG